MQITFTLAKPEFAIRVNTTDDDDRSYRYVIDDFKLLINRVKVTPTVAARVEEKLLKR